jgi:hypothetical protein
MSAVLGGLKTRTLLWRNSTRMKTSTVSWNAVGTPACENEGNWNI